MKFSVPAVLQGWLSYQQLAKQLVVPARADGVEMGEFPGCDRPAVEPRDTSPQQVRA